MEQSKSGLNTICVHEGEVPDPIFGGAVSPLYMATSYPWHGVDHLRYPRMFNTPNQEALRKKIAALEGTEDALIFGSGMAAVSNSLMAFLQQGDHVLLQKDLYGGTYNLLTQEFHRFGIAYSFTSGLKTKHFEKELLPNTKLIYIETPSNPLLKLVDIKKVATLAKKKGLISMIDNTFASPIIQNPHLLGIDIVIHSATKYMGGHSDILAGAVAGSEAHINTIWQFSKNMGGNLSDHTVWLLERSMKTLSLRMAAHNSNAKKIAKWLDENSQIKKVYYPGLKSHPDHKIAKKQMRGFGGMLSFELQTEVDLDVFIKNLRMIKPTMSLAGVESTIISPTLTSHSGLPPEERAAQGISDGLLRFSVGIEDIKDIILDLEQALDKATKTEI